jgi:1-acyl-sn-glycerol-3-phosphate acyltransferase
MAINQNTFSRRLLSISLCFIFATLMMVSAIFWIPMSFLLGVFLKGAQSATRCLCFITVYVLCECAGIVASFWLWLKYCFFHGSREDYLTANSHLQYWWADTLRRAAQRLFRLKFIVEGAEEVLDGPGAILLPRHTSIGDTVLPMSFYAIPRALRVRYVLKKELLLDPCLDIVGNRLPNVFLDRVAEDKCSELAALRTLASGAGENESLVIYIEGTRYSESKRQRILRLLAEKGGAEALRRAERLTKILPPRPAGALALMAGAPHKDLLFCAHTGFEGSASFATLFNGGWLNTTVRLRFWRIAAADIPADEGERRELLLEQWDKMNLAVVEMSGLGG